MVADWKAIFNGDFLKKFGRLIYDDVIYPLAKQYVASTDNPYDDSALDFLNDFVKKLLA